MKKLKYLILLLCFSFILIGCTKNQDIETTSNTPLLLEVTKTGTNNKLYLFGSIHAAEEAMYPLPKYVTDAYKKSDLIAVEFDIIEFEKDISSQMNLMSNFINVDGKKIKDYLDEDTYNTCIEILKSTGYYVPMLDSYDPIIWYTLIENAVIEEVNLNQEYGIDKYLLDISKKDKKEILELESADYQYDILSSFDYETQIYLLKQSIELYEESKNEMDKLYNLYKIGDKDELEKLFFETEEETDKFAVEFNTKMITDRNNNMANNLKKEFEDGKNIFCTVGLAHIIGPGGIADLLEQEGYTIKVIK